MTPGSEWSARVMRPCELSANEVELWSSFCRSDAALGNPFFSYAFARAVDRVRPHVHVAVLERRGSIVGFLPFQFRSTLSMLARAAERVGGGMADRFGAIAADDLSVTPAELLALARLNSLTFTFLPAEQRRHGLSGQRPMTGLQVVLSGDEHSYWTGLKAASRKFASQIERNERLLEKELGPLRMTFHADPEAELPRLIALKREQYQRTGGDDPLATPWMTDLLRELMRTTDPQCTGVLSSLYAGDTFLASHLGIMSEKVFHYWFPVYSRDWSRFSPGNILMKALVLAALSSGARCFDMAGYGQYKAHFRPASYEFHTGFWRTDGLGGLVNEVGDSLSWRIGKMMHRLRGGAATNKTSSRVP